MLCECESALHYFLVLRWKWGTGGIHHDSHFRNWEIILQKKRQDICVIRKIVNVCSWSTSETVGSSIKQERNSETYMKPQHSWILWLVEFWLVRKKQPSIKLILLHVHDKITPWNPWKLLHCGNRKLGQELVQELSSFKRLVELCFLRRFQIFGENALRKKAAVSFERLVLNQSWQITLLFVCAI